MTARPTMKDVARAAGVSPMTVSRVVSGAPGVAPDTTATVERAIRHLDYQRNDFARHLRRTGSSTGTVGLVVDDLANPFFAVFARAVEDEAHRRGYLVLVGSSNDELSREREVVSAFSSRQVDGMIIVPATGNHTYLKAQQRLGLHLVCADRPADDLDVDTVTVDNRDGTRQAVAGLLARGHRRIGYLGDLPELWTVEQRFHGYLDALAEYGIAPDPGLIRRGIRSHPDAVSAVAELMDLPTPPTALFASNDLAILGAIDALAAIPTGSPGGTGRTALIGFDDLPLLDRLDPPVTVVSQDPTALGATAASLLFARIDGDTAPPRSVVLMTRLVERGSGEILPP